MSPDPWLQNVNADMEAFLLLERAFCSCEARCECEDGAP